jgi:hypothetical protein
MRFGATHQADTERRSDYQMANDFHFLFPLSIGASRLAASNDCIVDTQNEGEISRVSVRNSRIAKALIAGFERSFPAHSSRLSFIPSTGNAGSHSRTETACCNTDWRKSCLLNLPGN